MTTLDLSKLRLHIGEHYPASTEMCLLEAAAFQAGEPWSDHPVCVSPVLVVYGRCLNDALPDETRQRLVPFVPRLLNTAGDGLDERRSYMAVDWLTRTWLPAWLRLIPELAAQADLLATAGEVVDAVSAAKIDVLIPDAVSQSSAVRDPKRAASVFERAARVGAAQDATWEPAGDAVRDNDMDNNMDSDLSVIVTCVRSTGRRATWNIAQNTPDDVFAATVTGLQDSAIDLFDRMLSVKR